MSETFMLIDGAMVYDALISSSLFAQATPVWAMPVLAHKDLRLAGPMLIAYTQLAKDGPEWKEVGRICTSFPQRLGFSLIRTNLSMQALAEHLSRFALFTDGSGDTYGLRIGDSRIVPLLAKVLTPAQWSALIAPMERWEFNQRDGTSAYFTGPQAAGPTEAAALSLSDEQIEQLAQATAPDNLLAHIGMEPTPASAQHTQSRYEVACSCQRLWKATDNNRNVKPASVTTNIAKLADAYKDVAERGFFNFYISGVGTPFTEIGKEKAEPLGGMAGAGGDARIVYGLLQVVNSVYRTLSEKARFGIPDLAALCSSTQAPTVDHDAANRQRSASAEQEILDRFGLSQGLLNARERAKFFNQLRAELTAQVTARGTLPRIAAIYLDVFGFSRGAAAARVFSSWLHKHFLIAGQMFGAPAHVRMLGLFDTVASVGATDGIGSTGHNGWAQVEDLRIHPEVRNCVHFVALHELRVNFPLDGLANDKGFLPPNCQEHHAPGAHSDVGGGYAPGEQGKGVRVERVYAGTPDAYDRPQPDGGRRLSNLTLNKMHEAAVRACYGYPLYPWIDFDSEEAERLQLSQTFGLDDLDLARKAVEGYFGQADSDRNPDQTSAQPAENLNTRDALRKHGSAYITWRYKVATEKRFRKLKSVDFAESLDYGGYAYYLKGQQLLEGQLKLLGAGTTGGFHPMAGPLYQRLRYLTKNLPSRVESFFDDWVHDSYAGFIQKFHEDTDNWLGHRSADAAHIAAEAQRYVRWRELYQGGDQRLNWVTLDQV